MSARTTATASKKNRPTGRASAAGPVIDWHAHWIGPHAVRRLPAKLRPVGDAWFDVASRIDYLDRLGIDRQVVAWGGASLDGAVQARRARPVWRAQNDDLGTLAAKYPDRFLGLATLPTANVEWAAAELERAHTELGLIGGILPLDAFVSLAGARSLAPIFEVAQKHRSHLYIHRGASAPTVPGQHPEFGDSNTWFGLPPWLGRRRIAPSPDDPADAAYARATLVTSAHLATGVITLALTDFLDPYPDVTVQFTMIGGAIAHVAEHIDLVSSRYGIEQPSRRLRRLYLDTGATGRGPRGVALAARVFGADRILFGTDYGPSPVIEPFLEAIRAAELTAKEKELILSGNGRALLASKKKKSA